VDVGVLAEHLVAGRVLGRRQEHRPLAVDPHVHAEREREDRCQVPVARGDLVGVERAAAAVEERLIGVPQDIEQLPPRPLRRAPGFLDHFGFPPPRVCLVTFPCSRQGK